MSTGDRRIRNQMTCAFVACALLFTACSSDPSETTTDTLPTLTDSSSESGSDSSEATSDEGGDPEVEGAVPEGASEWDLALSFGADDPLVDGDRQQALAEFERCMAGFGIDVGADSDDSPASDSAGSGDGGSGILDLSEDFEGDPEVLAEAEETCNPIFEGAFDSFELNPEEEAEMADALFQIERCLRTKGFDVDLDDEQGSLLNSDEEFEAFNAAMDECTEAAFNGEAAG